MLKSPRVIEAPRLKNDVGRFLLESSQISGGTELTQTDFDQDVFWFSKDQMQFSGQSLGL